VRTMCFGYSGAQQENCVTYYFVYNHSMPEYRRIKQEGGTYFFTLVTYQRQKLFAIPHARALLRLTVEDVKVFHPFEIVAYCILPDHVHLLWTLPEDDMNYSMRIGLIKRRFSKKFIPQIDEKFTKTESQLKRHEVTIWQRRFWEHLIRDEQDLERHIEYIHYNPVKHGLVSQAYDWDSSSFHDYVRTGKYPMDWGSDYNVDSKKFKFGE
jgi:putative transposase